MQFEADHGLATDGIAGPQVWAALLQAVARRQVNSQAYDYVFVATGAPEFLSLWRDGAVIFTTLVNTGITVAPTALGTYPVYALSLIHISNPGPSSPTYWPTGRSRADAGCPR